MYLYNVDLKNVTFSTIMLSLYMPNDFRQNLVLMRELNDRLAIGRACGNLGNTYYLLGEFNVAVQYHTERLEMAKECKDKAAERRAHSNLGNSHIFLGQFENAADHYK